MGHPHTKPCLLSLCFACVPRDSALVDTPLVSPTYPFPLRLSFAIVICLGHTGTFPSCLRKVRFFTAIFVDPCNFSARTIVHHHLCRCLLRHMFRLLVPCHLDSFFSHSTFRVSSYLAPRSLPNLSIPFTLLFTFPSSPTVLPAHEMAPWVVSLYEYTALGYRISPSYQRELPRVSLDLVHSKERQTPRFSSSRDTCLVILASCLSLTLALSPQWFSFVFSCNIFQPYPSEFSGCRWWILSAICSPTTLNLLSARESIQLPLP
jgi:hypothetical protein